MTYRVVAKRWARGWELHVEGVGVTQSRTLADAEDMARDYIGLQLDLSDAEFSAAEIEIVPALSPEREAQLAEVKARGERWAEIQKGFAAAQRTVARAMKDEDGLSGADIARILKVSPQRVSQLLKE